MKRIVERSNLILKVAIGKGEVHLSRNKSKNVSIPNVYYVPVVSEATKNGTSIQFNNDFAVISHELPTGEMLRVTCSKSGRLYPLRMMVKSPIQALFASGASHIDPTMLWHHRLGHRNAKAIKTRQVHKLYARDVSTVNNVERSFQYANGKGRKDHYN